MTPTAISCTIIIVMNTHDEESIGFPVRVGVINDWPITISLEKAHLKFDLSVLLNI